MYVVDTHQNHIGKMLLMSTHNIHLYTDIGEIIPELAWNTPRSALFT